MTEKEIKAKIEYHETYIKWYCSKGGPLAKAHRRDIRELKAKLKGAA